MVTHSSILAWEIPWTEEQGGYRPWHPELNMTERAHTHKESRRKVGGNAYQKEDKKKKTKKRRRITAME